MKILLIYPQYPDTFWSFKYALRLISKRAANPPLGLLTVAAMLPQDWEKKLVDMNVSTLKTTDINWADYIFVSAMVVQRTSAKETIDRCHALGKKVVAGGPLFSGEYENFNEVDHLVLGEAETTLPLFLADLKEDRALHTYDSNKRPDITATPIPLWALINMGKYASMNIQYSRGCPFDCEFCNIITLNGRYPRTKTNEQILEEMNALYVNGWRGSVFIVDDNFIGNKKKLKAEVLPAMIRWSEERNYPFTFLTEASINLADDEELMHLMVKAGFNQVFVGIETPNEKSLVECNKYTNKNRDLLANVKKIHSFGMEVEGGFIVGFDNDPQSIFHSQISFIQNSGIVTAMVGLLNAPRGTRLYQRLRQENRLLNDPTGDNVDCSINFVPKMPYDTLMNGYRNILNTIYAPRQYYERITTFIKEYNPYRIRMRTYINLNYITAFLHSIWILGITSEGRTHYWRLLFFTLLHRPRLFPLSMVLAVYGVHFRHIVKNINLQTAT